MVNSSSLSGSSGTRYRAAGFWRRLLSGIFDLLILSPVLFLFFWGLCGFFRAPFPKTKEFSPDLLISYLIDQRLVGKAFFFLAISILFLYYFLFHALLGSSIGERLMKMNVIDSYGERPSFFRTLLRTLGMGISLILAGAGFLWIAFDREGRAFHDWIGGTYMVLQPQEKKGTRK